MKRYPLELVRKAQRLRSEGCSFNEINSHFGMLIPKGTISFWCKDILIDSVAKERLSLLKNEQLQRARFKALKVNKRKRENFLKNLRSDNISIARCIKDPNTSKIALAMLCLGEASKYNQGAGTAFCLGNSDPRIITLFLELLKRSFPFQQEKVRCTVQCRADQDIPALEDYWSKVTGIPKSQFYKARIDRRTEGKPTTKEGYKGVLRVNYFDTSVQLELEYLAQLVWEEIR